jgi:CheY-like chemotaxis protein
MPLYVPETARSGLGPITAMKYVRNSLWSHFVGLKKREILCIDDDVQGLKVRGILLESMGYKVWTEPDAEHGLRSFREHAVDAVVMDYEMPGMTGADAAVQMKALRPKVPVLILSALPWLPAGAPADAIDGFIQKGEPLKVLAGRLEKAMSDYEPFEEPGAAEVVGGAIGNFVGQVANVLRKKARVQ